MTKPSILIIDNQNPQNSPRTLQEIEALKEVFDITLAGNGKTFNLQGVKFISFDDVLRTQKESLNRHFNRPLLIRKLISAFHRLVINKEFSYSQRMKSKFLKGGFKLIINRLNTVKFNVIINHHLDTLPLAVELGFDRKVPVIVNAHEYYLEQHAHNPEWMKNYHGQIKWIFRKYLHRSSAIFTVGEELKNLYAQWTSCPIKVIPNDRPFVELQPSETRDNNIKLVHHGNAFQARKIEQMIEVMSFLPERYSLTLYLVNGETAYMNKLRSLAQNKNVFFKDPVKRDQLPSELNQYDIGIHILPPVNTNHLLALPNKFFDFIQARLCIVTGPSPEMAQLMKKYSIGESSKEFSPRSVANTILNLSTDKINRYKERTNKAALELNSQNTQLEILKTVKNLVRANHLKNQV